MERQPIVSSSPGMDIRLIQYPMTIDGMFPDYRYEFQSADLSDESTNMYNNLVEFITINKELALDDNHVSRDDYAKGFRKALALVRLWIDYMYLGGGERVD